MQLFKAHFIHPHTEIPLIIYYNKSNGHVTFEKDNDILTLLIEIEKRLDQDQQFDRDMSQTMNMCETQYPVRTFNEVFELLEGLGVHKKDLTFKQLNVH